MGLTAAQLAKRNKEKKKRTQKKIEDNQRTQLEKLRKLPKRMNVPPGEEKIVNRKMGKEQNSKQKEKKINKNAPRQKNPPPPQVANKRSGTVPHSFKIKHQNLCTHLKTSLKNIEEYKKAVIEMKIKHHLERKKYEQKLIHLKEKNDELRGQEEILKVVFEVVYCKGELDYGKEFYDAISATVAKKSTASIHGKKLHMNTEMYFSDLIPDDEEIQKEMKAVFNLEDLSKSTLGKIKFEMDYMMDALMYLECT